MLRGKPLRMHRRITHPPLALATAPPGRVCAGPHAPQPARPAPRPRARAAPRRRAARPGQPRVGMVSLGCPKALVDSERILTRLRAEGYAISPDYAGADAVIVNTCGFLDSRQGREPRGDRRGARRRTAGSSSPAASAPTSAYIRGAHPTVLAVTGPHQYEAVLDAVHAAVPPAPDPFVDLLPAAAVHLTPRHYSYLKISEGCNHKCRFCIIPDMRGRLVSRPAHAVLREAERLVAAGRARAPRHQPGHLAPTASTAATTPTPGRAARSAATSPTSPASSARLGAWVRLHYVYPYPHVRELIPLMADGPGPPLPRHPLPARATPTCCAAWPAPPPRRGPSTRSPAGAPSAPTSRCARPSSSATPARPRPSSSTCSTGSTRRSSTASAASSTRTSPAPAPTPCPTTSPRRSSRSAGSASWRRRRRSAPRSSPPGSAPARRSSSTRSTPTAPPAAPRATPPRSTATSSSTRASRRLRPGDIVTVEVDEASDYDLWGSIRR